MSTVVTDCVRLCVCVCVHKSVCASRPVCMYLSECMYATGLTDVSAAAMEGVYTAAPTCMYVYRGPGPYQGTLQCVCVLLELLQR